jgi:hypothetical protein
VLVGHDDHCHCPSVAKSHDEEKRPDAEASQVPVAHDDPCHAPSVARAAAIGATALLVSGDAEGLETSTRRICPPLAMLGDVEGVHMSPMMAFRPFCVADPTRSGMFCPLLPLLPHRLCCLQLSSPQLIACVHGAAAFQRRFLFPSVVSTEDPYWLPREEDVEAELLTYDLMGVDNSRWHTIDRPSWNAPPHMGCAAHLPLNVPPASPLHAWLGLARRWPDKSKLAKALFEVLLATGCSDPRVLNWVDEDEQSLLSYSLRTGKAPPNDLQLLPFRLLMEQRGIDATRWTTLRTALRYSQHTDIVLALLGAHADPVRSLLDCSGSACVQLLGYHELAMVFLPAMAAKYAMPMFLHTYKNAGDFACELVESARDELWDAVTARVPNDFRLPALSQWQSLWRQMNPAWKEVREPRAWWFHDGLRAAIAQRRDERALWLLAHTGDDELDTYDAGGQTVLMRAIGGGVHNVKLILALLDRTPALEIDTRELKICGPGPALAPDALERGDIVLGKTARELIEHWTTHNINAHMNVSLALAAAQVRAADRRTCAAKTLATDLPLITELRSVVASYAMLSPIAPVASSPPVPPAPVISQPPNA